MNPTPPAEARAPMTTNACLGAERYSSLDTKEYAHKLRKATRRRCPSLDKSLSIWGLIGLCGVAFACLFSIYWILKSEEDFHEIQQAQMKELGSQILREIQRQLETSVSSTKALAALVPLDAGAMLLSPLTAEVNELKASTKSVADASEANKLAASQRKVAAKTRIITNSSQFKFNSVAESLIKTYKGISNLQLAPSGVVSVIHPIQTNEGAIGHDLFYDPARREEALKSITSGSTVFVGPLTLIQNGETAIVARHPIFIDGFIGPLPQSPSWWGFATMLSTMDDLFQTSQLSNRDRPEAYVMFAEVGGDARLLRASPFVPGQPQKVTNDPDKLWMKHAQEQDPIKLSFDDAGLKVHWELWLWPKNGWPKTGDTFTVHILLCVLLTVSGLFSLYSCILRESVIADAAAMSMSVRSASRDSNAVIPVNLC